jgi:hypothetical protein
MKLENTYQRFFFKYCLAQALDKNFLSLFRLLSGFHPRIRSLAKFFSHTEQDSTLFLLSITYLRGMYYIVNILQLHCKQVKSRHL